MATGEQLYLHVDRRKGSTDGRADTRRLTRRRPSARPVPAGRGGQRTCWHAARLGALMPKIVDHAQRRDEIALVACRVVAEYGFEQATIVRIAREAGYTTGMVAHYFDTKQDIIIAALRLILRRIEERLTAGRCRTGSAGAADRDAADRRARYIECAFWIAFWGQVSADKRLKRINAWLHREYMRLFERCLARGLAGVDPLVRDGSRTGAALDRDLHQRHHGQRRRQSAATGLPSGRSSSCGCSWNCCVPGRWRRGRDPQKRRQVGLA